MLATVSILAGIASISTAILAGYLIARPGADAVFRRMSTPGQWLARRFLLSIGPTAGGTPSIKW